MKSELIEPFPVGSVYWPQYDCYKVIGKERLCDTFLRWSMYNHVALAGGDFCKYLYKYCTHPQYEMLLKMGLSDIVNLSLSGDDMKRHFSWSEKGKRFFRSLRPHEVKELCRMDFPVAALKGRDFYKKCAALSLSEAQRAYMQWNDYEGCGRLIRKYRIDPRKFDRYIDRQNEKIKEEAPKCSHGAWNIPSAVSIWKDYIQCAAEIGYDTAQEVVAMPSDIVKAHDDAVAVRNALRLEEQAKAQKDNEEKAKKRLCDRKKRYEYTEGDYTVMVPETLRDIIKEGQDMQHCVAGYCERHAEGKTTILFIRRVAEPEKAFVTVEMSKKDVILQCRAKRNASPSPEVLEFTEHYKKWLSENIKRINAKERKDKDVKRSRRKSA